MKKIIGLIFLLVLISGNVNACDVYCSTCEDCNSKINLADSWQTICLNTSIQNHTGTCINPSSFNNTIFDCQGNIINGNAFYVSGGISIPGPTYGIYLNQKSNNTIRNCIISGFGNGIALDFSSNNTLINTTTYSNEKGILLKNSPNNYLRNNTMFNNTYNFNIFGPTTFNFYQDIDTSNLVDSKPIFYWTNEKNAPNNCKDTVIFDLNNTGFVALISCNNITVKNLNLHANSYGILLVNTTNSKILNNTINATRGEMLIKGAGIYFLNSQNNFVMNNALSLNEYGISLDSSSSNTISDTTINLNGENGISLSSSSNNNITNNSITLNSNGIYLQSSSNNNITNNTITLNSMGINILNSHFNKILENKILENTNGITLSTIDFIGTSKNINNTIERNEILYNSIGISSQNSNSIINSNIVCENDFDFNSSNWESSSGYNNTCNNPDRWDDINEAGCTNACKIDCNCSSYNQCIRKLNNSNCAIVTLLNDITLNLSPFCFTNRIFDCQGHKIIGTNDGGIKNIGIKNIYKSVIKNCIINNFTYGIYLNNNSNTIINNTLSSNNYGIYLSRSSNNTLINNTLKENSEFDFYINFYKEVFFLGPPPPDYSNEYCNNIIENNTGSGNNPIKFFNHSINLSNETLSELILCNADNSKITNITINGNANLKNNGLFVFLTEDSNFTYINSSNNKHGIYLEKSSNNNLTNITVNSNSNYGIYLKNSLNNIIIDAKVNLNNDGIFLLTSSNNTLINSTANLNKEYGIYIQDSSDNILINNTANSNIYGIYMRYIYLNYFPNNTMKNNTMKNNSYNFGIDGRQISDYYHDIDTSNLVDGKSIYYLTNENALNNCKNFEINETSNAGFVALVSCSNITVKNLNGYNNSHGILLINTTNSKILNNTINSNYYGIHLFLSSNNTINSNICCENTFLDFYNSSSYSNIGENNTCTLAAYWNDTGALGCAHTCSGTLCICTLKWGLFGKISRSCNCCTQFDFDNNEIIDIFDAVAALEHLSGKRNEIFNMNCSDVNNNGIDLIDIFYLIEKLQSLH
ncbi:hypothetical protein CVT91_06685 [Candidatus Atribacteria bacterium HGW-Atribacteria-1]|nr:MAG: hypothetical protein CVT91_06685 [Candidatus Atribacteria bacterium HGW-Atribacteria-1]